MQTISEVLEELDLLRALEVERLQLGTVAAWQGDQISFRSGPIRIHVGAQLLYMRF
jgi:hypothetical protein